MLEAQKDKMYHRSRLRSKGVSEEEIAKTQMRPFRPAFVNGKRRERESDSLDGVPTGQFAFRHEA